MIDEKRESQTFFPLFWQSPFALAAGIVIVFQLAIYITAFLSGRMLPYELLWPLTLTSTLILTAGLYPGWNYLRITNDGIEQHAGLTALKIDWQQVKQINSGLHGLTITYFDKTPGKDPRRRKVQLLNRYGQTAEEFHARVDDAWQNATACNFQ